ncbi:MAG TPA: Ig-like domain-containing protein [Clostridia bacterium]|nr:Ig-like domain-containing protein [Clostridia bacterium]
MKKAILLITAFVVFVTSSIFVNADSPITSSIFYQAYSDVAIVTAAEKAVTINDEIAKYLSGPNNPIDVKAAVINALSWNMNGKNNAAIYSKLIYNKDIKELNTDKLRGDELFCLGYLLAIDDYHNPQNALPFLEKASKKSSTSFTVALIKALVEAQINLHIDFSYVWKPVNDVLNNKNLVMDMRPDAETSILDYMRGYEKYSNLNTDGSSNLIPADAIFNPPIVYSVSDKDKTVSGKTKPLFKVIIKRGNIVIGTSKVDSNGSFTANIPVQKAGTELTVEVTDSSGNNRAIEGVTVKDATPPPAPVVKQIKSSAKIVNGRAEAGSTVTLKVGNKVIASGTVKSNGSFTICITPQKPGTVICFTAKDKAGNTSTIVKIKVIK